MRPVTRAVDDWIQQNKPAGGADEPRRFFLSTRGYSRIRTDSVTTKTTPWSSGWLPGPGRCTFNTLSYGRDYFQKLLKKRHASEGVFR